MRNIFVLLCCLFSTSAFAGYTINPSDQSIRGMLWPGAKVPYVIDSSMASTTNTINDAINNYHQKTVIRWIPRTTEKDYVVFISTTMSAAGSSLGMQQGKQWILVHPGEGIGTLIHEMGHTIGLYHEFNNPEQKQWVSFVGDINNANDAFCKQQFYDKQILGGISKYYRWDSQSIMHYAHGCFLNQNAPLQVNANYPGNKRVYPVDGWLLSPGDIVTINKLYSDKNFPVTPALPCADDPQVGSAQCKIFKDKGDCENYSMAIVAWESCKATCGICKPGMIMNPSPTPVPTASPTVNPTAKPTAQPTPVITASPSPVNICIPLLDLTKKYCSIAPLK